MALVTRSEALVTNSFFVTTSKAPVTTSEALVPNSFLLLSSLGDQSQSELDS